MRCSSVQSRSTPWYVGAVVHLTTALLLAGCSDPAPGVDGAVAPGQIDPAEVDPALLEPLTALGPCPPPPPPLAGGGDVAGLVLPEGAVVTSITRTDPVVQVQGWIPMTPIQVRVHYAGRSDVEVLSAEDEVREAEVLVTDGSHRLFVKAQAACDLGSAFVAVIAPEDAAGAVPTPAGAAEGGGPPS
jgi:hypothetical protein